MVWLKLKIQINVNYKRLDIFPAFTIFDTSIIQDKDKRKVLSSYNLKFKSLLILAASLFAIVCSCAAWSKDVSVLQGKPIFKLEIEGHGLKYVVSANGGRIFNEFDADSQISIDLPINQLMHPESSEFNFVIIPKFGKTSFSEHSFLHVTLLVQGFTNKNIEYRLPLLMFDGSQYKSNNEMGKSLIKGRYHLTNNNEVKRGSGEIELDEINKADFKYVDGAMKYSRHIVIPNSLPLWAFFNSDTLPDYDAMSKQEYNQFRKDLFPLYKKVQDALIEKDVEALVIMFAERSREADLAFYQPLGTMSENVRKLTKQFLDNPDWVLKIRTWNDLGLVSYNNDKLVSLNRAQITGAIGFEKKNGSYYGLEIIFRKQDDKWIVTR